MYDKVELKNQSFDKRRDTSTSQSVDFPLPLVNAKHGDNGVMYYGRDDIFDSAEMTIDIVQNGQIATGDVYPQPQKTGVLWDAYLIKAKSHTDTRRTLCYIAAAIYKVIKPKYSYDKKAYWEKCVSNDEIILPVDKTGRIDFDFMEKSIRELEQARVRELDAYLEAAGLTDIKLTATEKKALEKIARAKTDTFKIESLFEIRTPPKRFNANAVTFGGDRPYVVRTSQNNGQRGCIVENEEHLSEGRTISFGQDTATIFYQDKPYFTGDKIKVMKFLLCELDERKAMYLLSSMRKAFANFTWGASSFDENILKSVEVSLPVDALGKIDFELIEDFIRAIMKKSIAKVIAWKDREIATTRKVASTT